MSSSVTTVLADGAPAIDDTLQRVDEALATIQTEREQSDPPTAVDASEVQAQMALIGKMQNELTQALDKLAVTESSGSVPPTSDGKTSSTTTNGIPALMQVHTGFSDGLDVISARSESASEGQQQGRGGFFGGETRANMFATRPSSQPPAAPRESSDDEHLGVYECKVPLHVDKSSGFNVIGRLLGPRGMTMKQMEQLTGCTIVIRGRGSVKCEMKEARLCGRPGWEHLVEPLHVYIAAKRRTVREAQAIVADAESMVRELMKPVQFDEIKRRQLIDLAICNGTYRPKETALETPLPSVYPPVCPSQQIRDTPEVAGGFQQSAVTRLPPPPPSYFMADAGVKHPTPTATNVQWPRNEQSGRQLGSGDINGNWRLQANRRRDMLVAEETAATSFKF